MKLDVDFFLNIKKYWWNLGYAYNMQYDMHSNKVFDRYYFDRCCEITSADETNKLLGITKGEDDTSVIITYHHIVQVFKLSSEEPYYELKKEWKTKLKFSSPVIYDTDSGYYIGVFHNLSIRMWTSLTNDIQLTVKYVFSSPILKIQLREDSTPLIIFKNGYCVTLSYGIENCKMLKIRGLTKETSSIEDTASYTWNKIDYICYIVTDKTKKYYIVTCPLKDEATDSSKMEIVKVVRDDNDDDVHVTCKMIVASSSRIHPFVYFTWNNGKIGKYYITKKYWKHIRGNHRVGPAHKDMSTALIGKNYFISYGEGYSNVKDSYSVTVANMDPIRQTNSSSIFREKPDKKTRIYCPVNEFAITVDSKTIMLWTLWFCKEKRTSPKDFNSAMSSVISRTLLPYFPVMGFTKNKAWRISQTRVHMK